MCICGIAEILSPQTRKRLGPQIANPQSVTFSEGPKSAGLRISDLRNLFADRPVLQSAP
jgi:hypothetical protein